MSHYTDKSIFESAVEEEKIAEADGQVPEITAFDRAMKFVLKWEGGYVNHPSDPGGETNFGISKKAHPDLDIKILTREMAKKIYRKEYWDKVRGDDLPEEIAVAVMDYAVNSGVDQASEALQGIVHAVVDGRIGDKTIAQVKVASDLLGSKRVAKKLVMQRSDFLCGLLSNPRMMDFMKGWMRRTHSLMAEVCE